MQLYPTFFAQLELITTTEMLDTFMEIESSFNVLEYTAHLDSVSEIFEYDRDAAAADILNDVINIYRAGIVTILAGVGITLYDPLNEPLDRLEKILISIMVLSTQPLNEVLPEFLIDDEDPTIKFAIIVSDLIGINLDDVMMIVAEVDTRLIEMLDLKENLDSLSTTISTEALLRFKKLKGKDSSGIMCNAVRNLEVLGYDVRTMTNTVASDISELPTIPEIVREISLLVLGSSVRNEQLEVVWDTVLEVIITDFKKSLIVNAKRLKLSDYYE